VALRKAFNCAGNRINDELTKTFTPAFHFLWG
jgi:hypothetical protein